MSAPASTLAELLAPVSVERFFEESWFATPLHIEGAVDKWQGLMDLPRLERLAPLLEVSAGRAKADGRHAQLPLSGSQLRRALDVGLTVQAEHLERVHPPLRVLLDAVRRTLGIPLRANVAAFVSGDGSGYGFHFDAVNQFILQLQGQKRWTISEAPACEAPIENGFWQPPARPTHRHYDVAGIDELPMREIELSPGDLLYLPPATWHRPEARGTSLHLCLTFFTRDWLEPIQEVLEGALLRDPSWRRHFSALPERRPEALREACEARLTSLREVVAALKTDDLVRAIERRLEGAPPPAPPSESGAWTGVFALDAREPVSISVRGDELLLAHAHEVYTLPAEARGIWDRIQRGAPTTADELARLSGFDLEDVEALVAELREAGLVRACAPSEGGAR